MKALALITISTLLMGASSFAQSSMPSNAQKVDESVNKPLEMELRKAKDKVQADEANIQKEEQRIKDADSQKDIDKANVKKLKAQKEEDQTCDSV